MSDVTYKIYYSSRTMPGNRMWCPDCVAVEAPLKHIFNQPNGPRAEIIYTGDFATWRNPKNVYRQEPFKVNSVPTVLKFKDGKVVARIQDADILDEKKMDAFMSS